jgi:hypothetical protein
VRRRLASAHVRYWCARCHSVSSIVVLRLPCAIAATVYERYGASRSTLELLIAYWASPSRRSPPQSTFFLQRPFVSRMPPRSFLPWLEIRCLRDPGFRSGCCVRSSPKCRLPTWHWRRHRCCGSLARRLCAMGLASIASESSQRVCLNKIVTSTQLEVFDQNDASHASGLRS